MKTKHYIIYKITNLINDRYYIGQHQTNNLNDTYLGSGIAIGKAIKKYGKENFKREILFDFDNFDEMDKKEKELVTLKEINNIMCYNLISGGNAHKYVSDITKEKISKSLQGNIKNILSKMGQKNGRYINVDINIINEIIQLYNIEFIGEDKLAEKFNLSRKKVHNILKNHTKLLTRSELKKGRDLILKTKIIKELKNIPPKTKYRIKIIAKTLNITRQHLNRFIKKYNINTLFYDKMISMD